jgi:hypothetical protein
MVQLSTKLVEVAGTLHAVMDTAKADLGLQAVYYGDQNKIPVTPVACIEPDTKTRLLRSATRVTDIDFTIFIIIYLQRIQSPQTNRIGSDAIAEDIEDFLHQDPTLGGILIHSYVASVNSGYVTKSDGLVRACRLQYTGRSYERLPM